MTVLLLARYDIAVRHSGLTLLARYNNFATMQLNHTLTSSDTLFDVRDEADKVSEGVRVWFHCIVAKLFHLAYRVRSECLTEASYLATRVTKYDADDVEKLLNNQLRCKIL